MTEEGDDDEEEDEEGEGEEGGERERMAHKATRAALDRGGRISQSGVDSVTQQDGDSGCPVLSLFVSIPLLFNNRCFAPLKGDEDAGGGGRGNASAVDGPPAAAGRVENHLLPGAEEDSQRTSKKCLRMLLGYYHGGDHDAEDPQAVNRDLSSTIAALTAAAYVGFLARFESSVYYRATRVENE